MEQITLEEQITFIEEELKIIRVLGFKYFKKEIANYEAILETLQKLRQKEILIDLMKDDSYDENIK